MRNVPGKQGKLIVTAKCRKCRRTFYALAVFVYTPNGKKLVPAEKVCGNCRSYERENLFSWIEREERKRAEGK